VNSLEILWQELDAEPVTAAGEVQRRLKTPTQFEAFLTQSRPLRRLGLLVAFDEGPGSLWKQVHSSHGVVVSVDPRAAHPWVRIEERDDRFHSVFAALVHDLVGGLVVLEGLPRKTRPIGMDFVLGRLARWQTCLRAQPEGLSGEKRAGLVGELEVLKQLVDGGVAPNDAVLHWTGPADAIQDFQFPGGSIEVKASRQTQPTAVRITSERQLDTTTTPLLLLVHVAVDERTGGAGKSLPEIVEAARDAVGRSSDAGLLLDDRLIEYGYLEVHLDKYGDSSYSIRSLDWYEVSDGFPRLVEADMPPGVGDAAYSLALSACEAHRLAPEAVPARAMELSS
jgi:hypothetical protein